MKQKMYSSRLDRDFELEVCEPKEGQLIGDSSDITIVRAIALENILYNELAGTVTWSWQSLRNGAIVVDICDDTGVHVAGVGDIDPKSLKGEIARKYPVATAWSRAISAAVVRYLGFPGRVYTDKSFEVETDFAGFRFDSSPAAAKAPVPVGVSEPKEVDEPEEVSDFSAPDYPKDILDAAISEEPLDTTVKLAPEDVIMDRGIAMGMRLGDIIVSTDETKFKVREKKPGMPVGRQYLNYLVTNGWGNPTILEAARELLSK